MSNATFTQTFGPFAAGVSSAGLQSAGVDQIELHRGSGWLHARLLLDHFVAFEEIEQAERAVPRAWPSPRWNSGPSIPPTLCA